MTFLRMLLQVFSFGGASFAVDDCCEMVIIERWRLEISGMFRLFGRGCRRGQLELDGSSSMNCDRFPSMMARISNSMSCSFC